MKTDIHEVVQLENLTSLIHLAQYFNTFMFVMQNSRVPFTLSFNRWTSFRLKLKKENPQFNQ